MPKYSNISKKRLGTCHPLLQSIFNDVIRVFDIKIIFGYRGQVAQNKAYREKKSTKKWPESTHNNAPSTGVDVVPYPINWKDILSFYFLAGIVKGIAHKRGITIRWGGDWDSDNDFKDQTFNDLAHFEVIL